MKLIFLPNGRPACATCREPVTFTADKGRVFHKLSCPHVLETEEFPVEPRWAKAEQERP